MYQRNESLAGKFLFRIFGHWHPFEGTNDQVVKQFDSNGPYIQSALSPDIVNLPPEIPPGPDGQSGYPTLPQAG